MIFLLISRYVNYTYRIFRDLEIVESVSSRLALDDQVLLYYFTI